MNLSRGATLLIEQPISSVPMISSPCCHLGSLLASHLHLALTLMPCSSSKLHSFNYFIQTFRPPHQGWPLENLLHYSVVSYLLQRITGEPPHEHLTPLQGWNIFQTLLRIPHNSHSIHSLTSSSSDIYLSLDRLGLGLFPIASSLNHSCVPNVFVKFTKNLQHTNHSTVPHQLELIASHNIALGQELTISYGPTGQQSFQFRHQILLDQYQFLCQCELCVQQKVAVEGRTQDGTIKGEKVMIPNNLPPQSPKVLRKRLFLIQSQLDNCLASQEESNSGDQFPHAIKAILEHNQEECLAILREHHSVLERLVPCSCEVEECLCLCYDILGHLSATLSDYQQGVIWVQKGIEILINPLTSERKGYEVNDIVILREKMKVIQMLYFDERWDECYQWASDVKNEMKPFIDCEHDRDYCELQSILQFLQGIPGVGNCIRERR